MKCTSRAMKKKLCVWCVIFFTILNTGCGSAQVELDNPYDLYETTSNLGIANTVGNGNQNTFFSNDLCVADDAELGTDTTTSQVAEGAGIFNLATHTVTYEKNIYKKLYPASTTKILTAYLTLKYCDDLDVTVTVSENAVKQAADSSVCGLNAGDVISLRALLYGLMLRSGNDAAIVLAEHISGSVEAFADLMNQEALVLGATQSHFANPNGLPDPEHYTSVYDLYLIFNAAVKNEQFVDIISTISYDAAYADAMGNPVEQTWANTNQYFTGYAAAPEGITVIGGKTGTTGEAGYCLVLYAKNAKGEPIVSIVLKADGKSNLYMLMNEMLSGFANN